MLGTPRDFIHVKDVSKIYNNIINSDFSGILRLELVNQFL